MTETPYDTLKYCDLIMKGGIASGVVYPGAITTLSKKYKFANIGGASAGAIAAGIAAAAEYARARGKEGEGVGIAGIAALPETFSKGIGGFFQPVAELKPLFNLMRAVMQGGETSAVSVFRAINAQYAQIFPLSVAVPILVALGFVIWTVSKNCGPAWALTAALAGAILLVAIIVKRAFSILGALQTDITETLPANNFGICSGMTEDPSLKRDGLTEWLADELDRIAGLEEADGPLTFRMLREVDRSLPIRVEMMTTNLSMRRPHRLPMETAIFWFEEGEFRSLFPARIVDHMVRIVEENGHEPRRVDEQIFWRFPGNGSDKKKPQTQLGDDLPLVVAIRMSLSFPILIQTVPLYAEDWSIRFAADGTPLPHMDDAPLTRCVFTDGGVSSNFPMHFFDKPLPSRPTFGVSLGEYGARRSGASRVYRPEDAGDGLSQAIAGFDGLAGFLMRIVDTSKDWQDSMLSRLSGYRERVATISLDSKEGGLNLDMPADVIAALSAYGEEAGAELLKFDVDEHRWRRFLTSYDKLTDWLGEFESKWNAPENSYEQLLRDYPNRVDPKPTYGQNNKKVIKDMIARMDELAAFAAGWKGKPGARPKQVPKPASELQIRPRE